MVGTRIISNLIPTSVTREKNFTVKSDIIGILAIIWFSVNVFTKECLSSAHSYGCHIATYLCYTIPYNIHCTLAIIDSISLIALYTCTGEATLIVLTDSISMTQRVCQ